jgi:hypothetical protein
MQAGTLAGHSILLLYMQKILYNVAAEILRARIQQSQLTEIMGQFVRHLEEDTRNQKNGIFH